MNISLSDIGIDQPGIRTRNRDSKATPLGCLENPARNW